MDRKRLFKTLTAAILSLFVLNFIAIKFYLYYSIWWADMPMHFLGGFCSGIAILWFLSSKNLLLEIDFKLIYKIVLGILIIGVLWELYEILFYNILNQSLFNVLDTSHDILFDLAGGTFAIFYFIKNTTGIAQNKVQ